MMASAQHPSPLLRHSSSSSTSSVEVLTAKHVCRSCEESIDRMQLVAELLLLRSGAKLTALYPVARKGESYSRSRDAIVANTKGLAVCIKDITKHLKDGHLQHVTNVADQIADKVTTLTEAAAHAAYVSAMVDLNSSPAEPGTMDQYAFSKARQLITLACGKLKQGRGPLGKEQILPVSHNIATNLAVIRQGCLSASQDEGMEIQARAQFENCVNCLDGALACFVSSLKQFSTTLSSEDRQLMVIFSDPLVTAVHSVVEYSNRQQFAGVPAGLSHHGEQLQTEILAGAMAIVSASTQLLNTATVLLRLVEERQGGGKAERGEEEKQWHRLVSCAKAVADACKQLASSIREHTPAPSPQLARALPSQR